MSLEGERERPLHDLDKGEAPVTGEPVDAVTASRAPWRVLPIILLVAAGLRVYKLGSLPPAIFRDEAEKALNGWSLLQHGTDLAGRPWPLFIEVFGVTTSAIYQYATIPFLAVGGLNEWTTRLPAATVGTLTVLFTWLLARRVWGWQAAAWAAGLLAISPWAVPLSRWAQQGVFLPLLFTVAVWAMAKSELLITNYKLRINDEKNRVAGGEGTASGAVSGRRAGWIMLTGAALALAMYAYDPARLSAPLLALAAAVIWWRVWLRNWRVVLLAFVTFVVFASPVIWLLSNEGEAAQARFRFLSVFQPGVPLTEGLTLFLKNYASHFSPGFLLIRGDEELRHSAGVGMLSLTEFAFAVAGLIVVICRRCRWGLFIIAWVLLAPVASSLTRVGVPHALRSQVALPAWQLLAAIGLTGVGEGLTPARRKTWYQLMVLAALLTSLPFLRSYFGSYASRSAIDWQYGIKQTIDFTSNPNTRNSTVFFKFVTGAEYLVPFYLKLDRDGYQDFRKGHGRYKVVPFDEPGMTTEESAPWVFVGGPVALASPMGLQQQAGWAPMPITAPGGEDLEPAMLLFLNPALLEQVKEQTTN